MLDTLYDVMPNHLDGLRAYLSAVLAELDAVLDEIASGSALDVYSLPTHDPREKGLLWIDENRNLKVSAG